jgi:hypothetical protein
MKNAGWRIKAGVVVILTPKCQRLNCATKRKLRKEKFDEKF